METAIDKNAICDKETTLESAKDGQDSSPPPPSWKNLFIVFRYKELSLFTNSNFLFPVS